MRNLSHVAVHTITLRIAGGSISIRKIHKRLMSFIHIVAVVILEVQALYITLHYALFSLILKLQENKKNIK
jgi:hypothetical protein